MKIEQSTSKIYPRRKFKLNFIALLSIISILFLTYYVKDVNGLNGEEYNEGQIAFKIKGDNIDINNKSNKKNIIMMVTDGTGPASINMARSFRQYVEDLNYDDILTLDKYLIGTSRTMSSNSLITDSAAGATAFSCGLKSYNGAIGVDEFQRPCGTILEALKLKGYKTGMVVTTSITDATPAAFSSHVDFRNMLDLIANQQIGINSTFGSNIDLMIGGGRCSFLPKSKGINESCRKDEMNLIDYAKEIGWNIQLNKEEFDELKLGNNENISLPIMSLLSYYNMPYDIDRDEKYYPSLYEETLTALNILKRETKDSNEGFFLLIEGSRIDHAGHHNDAHTQVHEVLAYDKAFNEVIKFAKESEVETFIISTSDHETGGLDIGRQISNDYPDYVWYPEVLNKAKHSGEYLNKKIDKFLTNNKKIIKRDELIKFIKDDILKEDLGIEDFEDKEIKEIIKLIKLEEEEEEEEEEGEEEEEEDSDDLIIINEVNGASEVVEYLKNMVSIRARIGWSTHGHTAVDVNIYGYCNTDEGMMKLIKGLGGNRENTDIGRFLEAITDSNLKEVSEILRERKQQHNYQTLEEEDERSIEEIAEDIEEAEEANDGFINVV
ncbi:hypothetical protein C6P40_002370 [Pichia californica]|uniref:Alkaline phosphatase n=1 Tax=Pichia californica TaxID=460514 RepID=A0A9P6WKJ3_9ASCO|nr:hypothetical protein C6P42_002311 [[Candida] californica]KAG0687428.1 hypothetical protein C6P40_002370 [[Candida] californica]